MQNRVEEFKKLYMALEDKYDSDPENTNDYIWEMCADLIKEYEKLVNETEGLYPEGVFLTK